MNMVEKVAKAINDTMLNYGDYKPDELARAAIAAMREPTEEMVTAGESYTDSRFSEEDDFLNGWQAAIDAALDCSTKQIEKRSMA